MKSLKLVIPVAIFIGLSISDSTLAQSFRRGGGEYNAIRTIELGVGKSFNAAVTEFYHHGEIAADGRNVAVAAKNQLVPCRVMQLGPGDYCRLAFQTVKGQLQYDVLYGGDPPTEPAPEWTCKDGLILETRHFSNCNLQNLAALRRAFESSAPLGSDFVEGVFHGCNPFSSKREPFFSKYTGYLDVPTAGKYGFITASQDASFLLIDDKEITSAPGRHGPLRFAFRNIRQDVQLSAGLHKFEYYHAAAGPDAIMAAYWEINPQDPKPKPQVIPPTAFHADRIARLPAGALTLRNMKSAPDFSLKISGEVPLPDGAQPLVAVAFRNASSKTLISQNKGQWDFGDGQTSNDFSPVHVFLRPGLYTVKLTYRLAGRDVEIANRVDVQTPTLYPKDKPHEIDDHLKFLESYNTKTLDAVSLRQLMSAYELKASQLLGRAETLQKELDEGPTEPNKKPYDDKDKPRIKRNIENLSSQSRQYVLLAVDAGKAAFDDDSAAAGDDDLIKIALHIAPIVRFRLGDSPGALQIWKNAAEKVKSLVPKAECQIAAADILVNDLVKSQEAKPLMDRADAAVGKIQSPPTAAMFQRVWGDYYAAQGDGKDARAAYAKAEQLQGTVRNFIESTAWKGAHSRSAEEFVKSDRFPEAAEELQAWQREYPGEKTGGYLTLLYAKYWAARRKYAQAIAQAEQLLAVNPDSAYADQALFLAADCESRLGREDRAAATLHSILKDYPGSPLVPAARKKLAELEKK
jgi:TolA-binding protein